MLAAHHLESAALLFEKGDIIVYSGSYGETELALVSAGFGRGAVHDFVREASRRGAAEIVYIGACSSSDGRIALRTVVLAEGGSGRLLERAERAAAGCGIPVVVKAVADASGAACCDKSSASESGASVVGEGSIFDDVTTDVDSGIFDDVTAGFYELAAAGGSDALAVLTVAENTRTGECMEEHERRSRFYAAARLVFEIAAGNPEWS